MCKINHEEYVTQWENKSTVPVSIYLPFIDKNHVIFNYPEWNVDRNQVEMCTFDYTHILNNLRYHICNKGFDDVATEAFIQVSDMDHDVLPRAVVELKLDRQNCAPKSVDIPKLITHIVHVNTTKHDPKCGFEFTMSTRDNYPCYLLSLNVAFA